MSEAQAAKNSGSSKAGGTNSGATAELDRQRVEALTAKFAEPQWLAEKRLQAWEAYLQTPMPSGREESWRKTDLTMLDLTKLHAFDLEVARQVTSLPQLPGWYQEAIDNFTDYAGVLFQTTKNGGYLHIKEDIVKKGVIFCDLATAIEKHPDKIQQYLSNKPEGEKFGLLALAMFNCGAFLYVPPGVTIDQPFLFGLGFSAHGDATEHGAAIFPRLFVIAEENSRADFVFMMGTEDDKAILGKRVSLASMLLDLHIKAGSTVNFLEVQEFSPDVFYIESVNSHVSRDANFNTLSLSVGGRQTKSDIATYLQAPGAQSSVLGAILGNGREAFNFNTVQEHNAPDTKSIINYRVAVKDEATSVYQGIIRVAKVAQRTDAYQSNKNLLLSSDAKADSVPKLEILANDVKCAHGATVGPVDRDQLFYLRSRGLTTAEAEELIVLGFFHSVLEQFSMAKAIPWLSAVVSRKIFRPAAVGAGEQTPTELSSAGKKN
jgi:Fe-S cluster assembly protein SufD